MEHCTFLQIYLVVTPLSTTIIFLQCFGQRGSPENWITISYFEEMSRWVAFCWPCQAHDCLGLCWFSIIRCELIPASLLEGRPGVGNTVRSRSQEHDRIELWNKKWDLLYMLDSWEFSAGVFKTRLSYSGLVRQFWNYLVRFWILSLINLKLLKA